MPNHNYSSCTLPLVDVVANCLGTTFSAVVSHSDFGMAQHMSADDRAESFRGSPLYMVSAHFLNETFSK